MTKIAAFLQEEGYILRSGGAKGADTYFEDGVTDQNFKDIYLSNDVCEAALEMAKSIHPNWNAPGMVLGNNRGRKLHARNCYQVLGRQLDTPSSFLICWTQRGEPVGGTRTAIKLAEAYDIPVLNFGSVKGGKYMEAFELFYMRVSE